MVERNVLSDNLMTFARGAGIIFVGSLTNMSLLWFNGVLVARLAGVELFGVYSLSLYVVNMLSILVNLGLDEGVVRYVSLYIAQDEMPLAYSTVRIALWWVAMVGAGVGVLLFGLAPLIANRFFQMPELTDFLRIMAVYPLLFAISRILLSAIRARKDMRPFVYVTRFYRPIVTTLILLVVLLAGWKVRGLAAAPVIGLVVAVGASIYYFTSLFAYQKMAPDYPTRQLLFFSGNTLLAILVSQVFVTMDIFVAGFYLSSAEIGIYAAVKQLTGWVPTVLVVFNPIFNPMVPDLLGRGEHKALEQLYQLVTRWIFSVSLPFYLLLILFGPEVLGLYGREFIHATPLLIIIGAGELIRGLVGPTGGLILMSGRSRLLLFDHLLALAVSLILCLLLIPRYGAIGAGLAVTAAIGTANLVELAQIKWVLSIQPYNPSFMKPLLASLGPFLVLLAARELLDKASPAILLTYAAIFGLGFLGLILAFGLEKDDLDVIAAARKMMITRFRSMAIFL